MNRATRTHAGIRSFYTNIAKIANQPVDKSNCLISVNLLFFVLKI